MSAIYHCAVAPAAAAAYMSETKVAGAVAELLHAEDVSPFHYNTRGWRKEIHLFMLKSAQGYLLRSLTGLDVGHNLNAKSVFTDTNLPEEAQAQVPEGGSEPSTDNPFAIAHRRVVIKR